MIIALALATPVTTALPPASAQTAGEDAAATAGAEAGDVDPGPEATYIPPYESQMLRLAEILGALQYLRGICGADEGLLWREQMNRLLEAETPGPERRRIMIDRFNRGYHGYAEIHKACTPSSRLIVERYIDEGSRIARDITTRYAQ